LKIPVKEGKNKEGTHWEGEKIKCIFLILEKG